MDAKMDIKTAGRTLDVFEAFEALKKPTSLSELAAHIGAPISSCHGLLRTLRNRGYLYTVGGKSMLYPTKRLLEVATTIAAHDPILEILDPYLVELRDRTGETVILGKRQDDHIVYLEVVEGLHTIRYAAMPGKLTPLHSSAIGKAMLGRMGRDEFEKFLAREDFPRITPNTLTSGTDLAAEIAESSRRGYFITRGENVSDVMAIARTVRLGASWLGVAIAGPIGRMSETLDAHIASLIEICDRIDGQGKSA
jgi:DNA-binding IclR family transcriptional regulator